MMDKIDYLLSVSGYGKQHIKTVKEMKKRNKNLVLVPRNKQILRRYEDNINDRYILSGHLHHIPSTPLGELAEKYSINCIRSFVFPEVVYDQNYPSRTYNKYIAPTYAEPKYDKYIRELHMILDFFDELYSTGFTGIHVTNQGAKIFRQVIQRVAEYHNVQSIRYSFNPLPNRRSVRCTNAMIFPELEEAVSTNLTKSEKERADNYIENFRKNESVYAPISEHSSSFYHRLTDLINSAKYRSEGLPESVIKKFTEPLLKYAGKRIQASMYEKNHTTDTAISKGEYIFYPIQYSVESRITLRAPDFYDQSNLVEFINRNLPLNTQRLLVKDHPNNIGHLSLWAAYHMSKRSVFVHPKTCTHKIIKNSDAVITLNNTVGHEAIMWQKPVIVLGDALYSGLGLTYDVKNISNFSNVAKKAIEEGGPTMKEVRRYVNGLYKVGDKVNMDDTSDKAVTRTVESILQRTKTS